VIKLECSLGESICELSQIFGSLAAQVPDGPPGYPYFVFHAGVLPAPPASVCTDRILFRKATHDYNGWHRVDTLWMYLAPQKCRELALFLLASGFHGPKEATTLSITHPDSAIRRIIIRPSELRLDDPPTGFTMAPFALRYYPAETKRFPWMYGVHVEDLPVLALSNADDCVGTRDEDWLKRDTVWLGVSPGTFRLAELLLNAGCSWNPVREYELEGDAGYRGVGPMSAELRIFLPGSDGWIFYPDEDVPKPNGR
jgi:hypothetical protein